MGKWLLDIEEIKDWAGFRDAMRTRQLRGVEGIVRQGGSTTATEGRE